MAFSNRLFFFFLLLLSISSISHSAFLINKECGKTPSTSDILRANVNFLILDLVTKATANGFAKSTYGSGDDTVYGIAECRGDISGEECSKCINKAGQELQTTCANTSESRILYHHCSLRYNTSNFIGQADTDELGTWVSCINMTDPNTFKKALKELMVVITVAGSNGENRKFGWGTIENQNLTSSETITIYGMAQCSWDLEELECLKCLDVAYNIQSSECGDGNGCFVIANSCALRYEITPFLFANATTYPAVTTRKITLGNI